jgi:hypothetical protein
LEVSSQLKAPAVLSLGRRKGKQIQRKRYNKKEQGKEKVRRRKLKL